MAITKIKTVKSHLRVCLNYTLNPDKTVLSDPALQNMLAYAQRDEKTGNRQFVAGINCQPENAYSQMLATKHKWGKTGSKYVQGYQIIQSFAPGEISPELAFKVGCKFAKRYLASKYECVVSTHIDREHLHCHIVFNSVSSIDGKMFPNKFEDYYQGIRRISDELCREYNLSVIDPKGHGKPYHLHMDAPNNGVNIRVLIQEDIRQAMAHTTNWNSFLQEMQRMGYRVGNRAGTVTFHPPYGKRNIRMSSLAPEFQESAVREYFIKRSFEHLGAAEQRYAPIEDSRHFHSQRSSRPRYKRHKVSGFMAQYHYYCFLLRRTSRGHGSKRYKYLLADELRKLDRYQEQSDYLILNHIETEEDLLKAKAQAEQELEGMLKQRKQLYHLRDNSANGLNKADLSAQIEALNDEIQEKRRQVKVCVHIQQDAETVRQNVAIADEIEQEELHRKEVHSHEYR